MKAANKDKIDLDGSGSATFNYTVKVTHDPGTLTNWQVAGTITILNFNDFAVADVQVGDNIDDDTNDTCVVTDGVDSGNPLTGQTVPAFVDPDPGMLTLTYACTYGAAPASDTEHNTVRVDWPDTTGSDDTADLKAGFATFRLPFTFGTPNPIDNCADVSDTFNGGAANGLAHVCANNTPAPTNVNPSNLANFSLLFSADTPYAGYGRFTFGYSRTIPFSAGTLGNCLDYTNRASFADNSTPQTTGYADKTVTVCFFGARLTPGYWKNHLADAVSGHTYSDGSCGTTALKNAGGSCSTNGPFAKQWANSSQWKCLGGGDNCTGVVTSVGYTGYKVDTILKAAQVFNAMNCSNTGSANQLNQNAIGCLAGHLLSAKYNRNVNGSDPCIDATIGTADAFLRSIVYIGTSGNYSGIGTANRNTAIALKTALDNYDNGGGCHS
jgi:hypothetical protein